MADIVVQSTGVVIANRHNAHCIAFTSPLIGYAFYITTAQVICEKTTDGGQTWAQILTLTTGSETVSGLGIWYDEWTPAYSGTRIHVAFINTLADNVYYRYLDTATDTLGATVTVHGTGTMVSGLNCVPSITRAKGGNLQIEWGAGSAFGSHRSTDNGLTWSPRTNVREVDEDWAYVYPANAADPNDLIVVYTDISANAITVKEIDDSANTVSESATIESVADQTSQQLGHSHFGAAVRHSDGHLILATIDIRAAAGTSDFRVFDINGAASIVEKTPIGLSRGNIWNPAVFIDQVTDDIYVVYNGTLTFPSEQVLCTTTAGTGQTAIYYKKSTDGGNTWGPEVLYSAVGGDFSQVWTPLCGDRFMVLWGSNATNPVLRVNYDNSIDLTGGAPPPSEGFASFDEEVDITVVGSRISQGSASFTEEVDMVAVGEAPPYISYSRPAIVLNKHTHNPQLNRTTRLTLNKLDPPDQIDAG